MYKCGGYFSTQLKSLCKQREKKEKTVWTNERGHAGMWFNLLTLSMHELGDVALPGPRLRLGHIHTVKVEVADQVVFGVAWHVDNLHTQRVTSKGIYNLMRWFHVRIVEDLLHSCAPRQDFTLHLFSQNPVGTNWKGRCVLMILGGSVFFR